VTGDPQSQARIKALSNTPMTAPPIMIPANRMRKMSFPIIIGGRLIDEQICRYVGADYWVTDAMSGVHLCRKLMARNNDSK
jgi:5-methyltetrahydrofolate--homocysteine methyltransferase